MVTTLRLTKPEMKDWNAKECREYIQYKSLAAAHIAAAIAKAMCSHQWLLIT
jgi:hypothetical protein